MKPTFNQIAALLLVGVCLVSLLTTRHDCPEAIKQAIIGVMTLCAGYLFGSTSGSHAKDTVIANSAPVGMSPTSTEPEQKTE